MEKKQMTAVVSRRERQIQKQEQKRRFEKVSREWQQELTEIRQTKEELERLYLVLENVVEEKLVESIIYQIKSAESRYDFHYLALRKLEQQLKYHQDAEETRIVPSISMRKQSKVG